MIDIQYSKIKEEVHKQLAIIGKHHSSPKGGTLFSTTDLTAIEESVIPTFIVGAEQMIVSALSPIITSYVASSDGLSFEVSPTRWGTALPASFADSVRSYIVAFVMSSVLSITLPDAAQKYDADAKNLLAALTGIAFTKQPPKTSTANYSSVSGSILNDDGSEFTEDKV